MPIQNGPPSRGSSAPARRAPTNFKVMRGNVASPLAAALGAGSSTGSAADQAQAILAPQEAQQAAYGQQQNAAIRSFANSLLGKLQPVAGQVGADYNSAIKQIGGLSGQAAQYFSGQNPTASQQALEQSVGAPAEQQAQTAQALGNTFRGGAGVLAFTQGVVPGSELAGDKAAAQASARQLPGIAALKGQQDLASALWKQSDDRMKLEATRPKLVADAQSNIDTANYRAGQLAQGDRRLSDQESQAAASTDYKNRALAASTNYKYDALATSTDYKNRALAATNTYRQGLLDASTGRTDLGYAKLAQTAADKKADRAATKAYHDSYLAHLTAGDSERVAHDKALEAAKTAGLAIQQENADTGVYNANTSRINAGTSRIRANTAANKPPAAPKLSTSASGRYGVQTDTSGNPILRNGKTVPYPKTGGTKTRTLTPSESTKFTKSATQIATNAVNGATDPKGVYHPPISRDVAEQEMRAAGLFGDPRSAKIAIQALNAAYGPSRTKKVKSAGPFGVQATATP
jgi:hypothetical protein